MRPITITILIFLTILFIILILYLFGVFTPEQPPNLNIEELIHAGEQKGNWQRGVPVSGPRGKCSVYTFPIGTSQSFERSIIDNLTPVSDPQCVDTDQAALELATRTCGIPGSNIEGCIGFDGKEYKNGEQEELYQPCNSYKQCKDAIYAAVAFNFAPDSFTATTPCTPGQSGYPACLGALCLQYKTNANNQVDTELEISPCEQSNANQYFRVTRAQPPDLKLNGGGTFAQILERNSGLCVVPSSEAPGSTVILGSCNTSNGFVWFLAPPVQYQAKPSDPKTITPQQLTYFKSPKDVPLPSQLSEYITKNKPLSIFPLASVANGAALKPTMQPFSTNLLSPPIQFSYNSQILDSRLYDIIAKGGPRVVGGNMNFPYYTWYG